MTENNQNKEPFAYTYSAAEQEELRAIREKYTEREKKETPLETIRRLDASVSRAAQTVALILGVLGALILGFGMSLIMTDLFALAALTRFFIGIPLGLLGALLCVLAYPVYRRVYARRHRRVAPEILRLTEEMMK